MWDGRWQESEQMLGGAVTEALKRLYAFYGDGIYRWIARLYDPEIGAFYYSDSARDHECFLPDIESTTQALEMVVGTGMTEAYGGEIGRALPPEICEKIRAFAEGLQDPSDGYFYHPQWGRAIGSSRKGRDLNSSIGVIRRMGGAPLYKTALERLSAPSGAEGGASVPEHMTSPERLRRYLEGLDVNADSHSVGHRLESEGSQLRAAGLSDIVCDWLDERQLPTGLWQPVSPRPYTALSGLLKLGSFYRIAGRQMHHCEQMIDTAIDVILADEEPLYVILVYNPWGGLRYALLNMRLANETARERGEPLPYDLDGAYAKIRQRAPAMLDKTVEKLTVFQKDGCSFSYCRENSAPSTQGVPVSLGVREGDVNGTALAMNTMSSTICEVLGIRRVPLYGERELSVFIDLLRRQSPPSKRPVPPGYGA